MTVPKVNHQSGIAAGRQNWVVLALCAVILIVLCDSTITRDIRVSHALFNRWRNVVLDTFNITYQFFWSIIFLIYIIELSRSNIQKVTGKKGISLSFLNPVEPVAPIVYSFLFSLLVATRYFLEYRQAAAGTDTLVLLCGSLIYQAAIWLLTSKRTNDPDHARNVFIDGFVLLGCLSLALSPLNPVRPFFYHGHSRWCGIFSTPNSLGMFASVLFMLSAGRAWIQVAKKRYGRAAIYVIPLVISSICVVKSYSRGAWVAITCGLIFLWWTSFRAPSEQSVDEVCSNKRRWKRIGCFALVGLLLGTSLSYGVKKALNFHVAVVEKIAVTFDPNDFSSRNRLASYQDGINMLVDRPLAGYGWQSIPKVHSELYLQPGLAEGQALALNDFLKLALHLGLPGLALLAVLIWATFFGRSKGANPSCNMTLILCRMVVVILFVSFNFSDGLLRLSLGGSFWLFLALSANGFVTRPQVYQVSSAVESALPLPSR